MTGRPEIALLVCRRAREALEAPGGGVEMPEGTRLMELPCSGRVDQVTILRALREGAWGVMVIGCLEGNCRFHSGNYQARRRVDEVRSILEQVGVDPRRAEMLNLASNQHARAKKAVEEMSDRVRRLGPVNILEGDR